MLKIAVGETHPAIKKILIEMIKKIQTPEKHRVFEITAGNNALKNTLELKPDILVINESFQISPELNGFEFVKSLKENGLEADIVFLTSHPEFINRIFGMRSAVCLLKPVIFEDINRVIMSSAHSFMDMSTINIRCSHTNENIYIKDIIYLEADKRNTYIRTREKSYISTENIGVLEKRLPAMFFFRTHRTYILNFRHIAQIDDNTIKMKNGEYVILSRHRRSEFKKALNCYNRKQAM